MAAIHGDRFPLLARGRPARGGLAAYGVPGLGAPAPDGPSPSLAAPPPRPRRVHRRARSTGVEGQVVEPGQAGRGPARPAPGTPPAPGTSGRAARTGRASPGTASSQCTEQPAPAPLRGGQVGYRRPRRGAARPCSALAARHPFHVAARVRRPGQDEQQVGQPVEILGGQDAGALRIVGSSSAQADRSARRATVRATCSSAAPGVPPGRMKESSLRQPCVVLVAPALEAGRRTPR